MTSIGKEIDLLMSIFILLGNDLRDCRFLPGGNIGISLVGAYWAGLGSVEAQFQVKKFSSKQYKSHREHSYTAVILVGSQVGQSASNEKKNLSTK